MQPTLTTEEALNKALQERNYERTMKLFAYERVDELHDTVHKMESRLNAMVTELRNVREFMKDYVVYYEKQMREILDQKWERERRAAEEANYDMENHYREMVEYFEEQFDEDSDALWKIILEE